MRQSLGTHTIYAFTAAAGAFAVLSLVVSATGRGIAINQSIFLLTAQQWVLGKKLYVDLGDVHPPPLHILNAGVVLLARYTELSLVRSFNLVYTLLALLSGILFGLASARQRVVAGSVWVSLVILASNDAVFAEREFIFVLGWVPYLMVRTGFGTPSRRVMIAAGAFAGYMVCIKPHFLVIATGTEVWLWCFWRSKCRLLPFLAFVVSGVLQFTIFIIFFDLHAYFYSIWLLDYYAANGFHHTQALVDVLRARLADCALLATLAALVVVARSSPARCLAEAIAATLISAIVLIALEASARYYYLQLLYLPAGALWITMVLCGPEGLIGGRKSAHGVVVLVVASLAALQLWYLVYNATAIGPLIYPRYVSGAKFFQFGGLGPDPFMRYVTQHIPKNEVVTILGSYGFPNYDPIASMVRLGRPVPMRNVGADFDLGIALVVGSQQKAIDAVKSYEHDLERSHSEWLFVRLGGLGPSGNIITQAKPVSVFRRLVLLPLPVGRPFRRLRRLSRKAWLIGGAAKAHRGSPLHAAEM